MIKFLKYIINKIIGNKDLDDKNEIEDTTLDDELDDENEDTILERLARKAVKGKTLEESIEIFSNLEFKKYGYVADNLHFDIEGGQNFFYLSYDKDYKSIVYYSDKKTEEWASNVMYILFEVLKEKKYIPLKEKESENAEEDLKELSSFLDNNIRKISVMEIAMLCKVDKEEENNE